MKDDMSHSISEKGEAQAPDAIVQEARRRPEGPDSGKGHGYDAYDLYLLSVWNDESPNAVDD